MSDVVKLPPLECMSTYKLYQRVGELEMENIRLKDELRYLRQQLRYACMTDGGE